MGLVRRPMVSFCNPVRKPVHELRVTGKSMEPSYSLVYLSLPIRRVHTALATGTRGAIYNPPGIRTITSSMNRYDPRSKTHLQARPL